MNNLRSLAAMMLLAAMLVGMTGIAPAAPMARTNSQVVSTSSLLTESVLNDWVTYLDEVRPETKLDSKLMSYRETGAVPLDVAVSADGRPSVLIAVAKGADMEGLKSIVDVQWMLDFKVAVVVSAYVGRANLEKLESFKGVAGILSDQLYKARVNGIEPRPTLDYQVVDEPAMYKTKEIIGANDVVTTYGYIGTDAVVGVCDTGVDFSHPDLQGAIYFDPVTGMPASFDPSGFGVGLTMYRFNLTAVNATWWTSLSSWNKLTSVDPVTHKIYIPGTWNPNTNNLNSLRPLNDWISVYLTGWWGDAYPNQANLTEFYTNVMRQRHEVPNASTYMYNGVPTFFAGWIFQQRDEPYLKAFAPAVVMNGSSSSNARLIIDWETANAYTQFWNLAINYGALDFNVTADRDYIEGLGDWNFTDNLEAGEWYCNNGNLGVNHIVLAHDYTGDGIADFGLGAICTSQERIGYGVGLVEGFTLGGRMVAILYDTGAHGTFVSGQIAGRGVLEYPVGLNGATHKLYGVANGSKLIGEMVIGTGSHLAANVWEAGFVYNSTSGYFEWSATSGHQAIVSSNSWGWVAPEYLELQPLYSLMYAALSTPGFFDVSYPGILYCFSAGNSGPGYATIGAPCAAQILSVGASTSYHTFDNSYGPNQGYDQIADFSSRGPLSTGYPKPDVLAPGRNTFGIVPGQGDYLLSFVVDLGWDGPFPLYATYAGTSMACPMVAGVVALLAEATAGTALPDEYKTIIQSTAKDLGLDGMSQGFGRVDAKAAVDYVEEVGSGVVWGTYDSTINYGSVVAEAWAYYMDGSTGWTGGGSGIFINSTIMPTTFLDSSLYYGVVLPGETRNTTMFGEYANGTYVGDADFSWASYGYEVDQVTRLVWETFIYNETTSTGADSIKAGWFDLQTELGSNWANFAAAQYATILLGGPTSLDNLLWAFVFDWTDTSPVNGIPDYYDPISGLGDELTRIQYGGDMHTIKMDLSSMNGVGSVFSYTPIVAIHDDTIWGWPYTGGTELNVTIITWKHVANSELRVSDKDVSHLWVNLTVPNDAEPGVHEGYLDVGGLYRIPYSYFVGTEITTAKGEETAVASGYGKVLNPMELGASFLSQDSYYTSQSADHHSFIVLVSNTSANYIGAKVEWADAESSFDVAIVDMTGAELGTSLDANRTWSGSASAIGELSAVPGDYIVYVTTNDLKYDALPYNFTLSVMCWTEIPAPTLTLSYRSNNNPAYTAITAGGTASGDHVRINATWTDAVLQGMPDYKVTSIEMRLLKGVLFTRTVDLVIPESGYDPTTGYPSSATPLELDQFVWVLVPGITVGANVRISIDFTVADCDIYGYWADTDNSTWTWQTDILELEMVSGAVPEHTSFVSERDGTLALGLFDYSGEAGEAYVTVDTRAGIEPSSVYGNTFEIDTYLLGNIGGFSVLVSSDSGTNLVFSREIAGLTFENFFSPQIASVTVTGTGAVKTITWTAASDLNVGDEHFYEIYLSSDNGVTYQLMAVHQSATSYAWDSTGFLQTNYTVKILAFDNDPAYNNASYGHYWPGLTGSRVSAPFVAGTVTTPTTSITTTTTTTIPVGPGIDPLWIGLFGGIGVGILVILILFLVRKK